MLFILENALYIIMSQACRHLRDVELSPRDKQFLKRELGAELVSSCVKYTPQDPLGHVILNTSHRIFWIMSNTPYRIL